MSAWDKLFGFAPELANASPAASLNELQRILQLPKRDYFDTSKYPDLTEKLRVPGTSKIWYTAKGDRIESLNTIQSAMLHAIGDMDGGVGPIAVGGGKAATALLAGTMVKADMTIVMAPPRTLPQIQRTYAEWSTHFRMPGKGNGLITFISYDMLSRKSGSSLLRELAEGHNRVLLVCDEVHRLANHTAARTKRVERFLKEQRPDAMFVGMSGTITSRSLKQMAHIYEWALHVNSPMPRPMTGDHYLAAWDECLKVKGRPAQSDWNLIDPLHSWSTGAPVRAEANFQERQDSLRAALMDRISSAPGVAATTKSSFGGPLMLLALDDVRVPKNIQELLNQVENDQEISWKDEVTGREFVEILTDSVAVWRAARTLSMGYFNVWVWPKNKGGKREVDFDWLDARADWGRVLRAELKNNSRENYDSPDLIKQRVIQDIEENRPLRDLHNMWIEWAPHDRKRWKKLHGGGNGRTPPTKAIWLSEYYMDYVVAWAKKQKKPTLFWYSTLPVFRKLREKGMAMIASGEGVPDGKPQHFGVSTISHSEGLDLQHGWANNFYIEGPEGGKLMEQSLARTHRTGQKKDEVTAWITYHTDAHKRAWIKSLKEARYATKMLGEQKLLIADLNGFEV